MAVENRGPELLAVIWVFTSLTIIVVALKAFTRAHVMHALDWDDFFIFFSAILIIICTSIFTYDVHLGMGKHVTDIPPELVSKTIKVNYIGNPFGIMAYSFPNISVAILVNRLLPPNRMKTIGLYTLAIAQCVIAAISCILLFAQATPTAYLWNPIGVKGKLNYPSSVLTGYSYFVGSFTAATDIILAVVPIMAFWKLNLKTKTKLGLCFLMACTLFAAICAIIKTTKLPELADLQDFTYGTVDLIIWAIVEANVIIIAACMPTMRPFVHHAFGKEPVSEGKGIFAGFRSFGRSVASSLRGSGSGSSRGNSNNASNKGSTNGHTISYPARSHSLESGSHQLVDYPSSSDETKTGEADAGIWRKTDFGAESLHTAKSDNDSMV